MTTINEKLVDEECSWPFRFPVCGVADYHLVILDPMGTTLLKELTQDLKTVREKIREAEISTVDQFVYEVNKIFIACRMYNGSLSNFTKLVNKLDKLFKAHVKKLRAEMNI